VSTTGRIFSYGDATPAGDIPSLGLHLNGSIVGITPDPVTGGYWLVARTAASSPSERPSSAPLAPSTSNQPVVAMQSTSDGQGYWFVASDGGIFSYGDAPFRGLYGWAAPQQAHGRHGRLLTPVPGALHHRGSPDASPRVTAHVPAT